MEIGDEKNMKKQQVNDEHGFTKVQKGPAPAACQCDGHGTEFKMPNSFAAIELEDAGQDVSETVGAERRVPL